MDELEIKVIDTDIDKLKEELSRLNAIRTFFGLITTISYDSKDKQFSKQGRSLTVKNFGDEYVQITVKGPAQESKYRVREEQNIISKYNLEETKRMVELADFRQKYDLRRHRESYDVQIPIVSGTNKVETIPAHIDIDDYSIIPKFFEIEARNEEEMGKIIRYFNLTPQNLFKESGERLFEHYGKKMY